VQAEPSGDARAWLELARRVEALGFAALLVADHPGASASPFSCLAGAASVTSTLRLGTYVCNAGVRDPLQLASDAATLDVLSGGRCTLGLGAGHTPAEWTMLGRQRPPAAARVTHLAETIDAVVRLLAGDTVTVDGSSVRTCDARLAAPRPVQQRIPILVGGNGRRLLRIAGAAADIVSVTGLGRTLADGHRHAADWSRAAIDERIAIVTEAAGDRRVVLDALVQHFEVTDDPNLVADRIASRVPGVTPDDVRASPFVLCGDREALLDEVLAHRSTWGFTSYVVREAAIDGAAALVARLNRST
jgi:probable F420-dependent oxidoreductase